MEESMKALFRKRNPWGSEEVISIAEKYKDAETRRAVAEVLAQVDARNLDSIGDRHNQLVAIEIADIRKEYGITEGNHE